MKRIDTTAALSVLDALAFDITTAHVDDSDGAMSQTGRDMLRAVTRAIGQIHILDHLQHKTGVHKPTQDMLWTGIESPYDAIDQRVGFQKPEDQ